jgi:hypothetical protein
VRPRRTPASTWAWRAITLLAAGVLGAGVAVAFVGPERSTRRGGGGGTPQPPPAVGTESGALTDTGFFSGTDFGLTDTGFGLTDTGFGDTGFGDTGFVDDGFVLPGELDAPPVEEP